MPRTLDSKGPWTQAGKSTAGVERPDQGTKHVSVDWKGEEMSNQDGTATQPYEVPGWLPALKRVGAGRLRPSTRTGPDGVIITRLLFLSLVLAALLLILFVLTFTRRESESPIC